MRLGQDLDTARWQGRIDLTSVEKQSTCPHQVLPMLGTALPRLRNFPSPCGRTLPCVLMRMNGCQPTDTILLYSQGAYKPPSLSTNTIQCSGTLPDTCSSN